MDFTRRIELDAPHDEAVGRVKDALKDQGFGVLTEIDVRQTLKDKLDVDADALGPTYLPSSRSLPKGATASRLPGAAPT